MHIIYIKKNTKKKTPNQAIEAQKSVIEVSKIIKLVLI